MNKFTLPSPIGYLIISLTIAYICVFSTRETTLSEHWLYWLGATALLLGVFMWMDSRPHHPLTPLQRRLLLLAIAVVAAYIAFNASIEQTVGAILNAALILVIPRAHKRKHEEQTTIEKKNHAL